MSYNQLPDADLYFMQGYGYPLWENLPDPDKDKLLFSAGQYLDTLCAWHGKPTDPTQNAAFPRNGDLNVPDEILIAELEIAYQILSQGGVNAGAGGDDPLTELKAGSVTLKFDTSKASSGGKNPLINDMTKFYLSGFGECNFGGTRCIPMELT